MSEKLIVPGLNRPFKPISPHHRPAETVLTAFSFYKGNSDSGYCDEIAEGILEKCNDRGAIIFFADFDAKWPSKKDGKTRDFINAVQFFQEITTLERSNGKYIKTYEYKYHAVFSDGAYYYDPVLHNDPISKSDYLRMMKAINPKGISTRYTTSSKYFAKGDYSRQLKYNDFLV